MFSQGCPTLGYYGEDCSLPCPQNCQESNCNIVDGTCLGCNDGYRGATCDKSIYFTFHSLPLFIENYTGIKKSFSLSYVSTYNS